MSPDPGGMHPDSGEARPGPDAAGVAGFGGGAWQVAQAAAVVVVLAFFLWALRDLLNPLILFFVLWAVAAPVRSTAGGRWLLGAAGGLVVFWLLSTTGSVLAPFVLALVLAYVLDPAVDRLERRWVPRAVAIVALTLPVAGVLALLLFVGLPSVVDQLSAAAGRIPELLQRVAGWMDAAGRRLSGVDLPFFDEEALAERLRSVDSAAVMTYLEERRAALGQWIWGGLLGVGRGLGAVLGFLGFVVLTPVLTFYLLRDWDHLTQRLADLVPVERRPTVLAFAREYDDLLSRYLRGQITVALAVGALTGAGLWALSFPYAWTLGLVVAVFSVVPYLGLVLSLIPALAIALLSGAVGPSLLKVAVVYGVAQGLEGAVISPRIVGESVGLHPVLVVLALAMGGFFFGFVGLLIAVPGAVGLKLLVRHAVEQYRSSGVYRGSSGDA